MFFNHDAGQRTPRTPEKIVTVSTEPTENTEPPAWSRDAARRLTLRAGFDIPAFGGRKRTHGNAGVDILFCEENPAHRRKTHRAVKVDSAGQSRRTEPFVKVHGTTQHRSSGELSPGGASGWCFGANE
ncbi:hypothetical protein ZHAS_00022088 [Anopheles sinensis]|uniref:Uncharacterized protein n=1 Tax=Anopheles sinensis TaxID=74873 RepID=A0A084WTY4_ANOSI|nr:hypothetical protein ZHAS_00022088 [Anopheles sinensis]